LGGIRGFQVGNLSGFDIKSNDGTLFAILNFESLSQNIEEGIFEKLCNDAQFKKKASYYYVDFSSKNDYLEKWVIGNEESSESHKRVFKTSGNKFYQLLTGNEAALSSLQSKLPIVIGDYLKFPV
jgi:hypothetical protein